MTATLLGMTSSRALPVVGDLVRLAGPFCNPAETHLRLRVTDVSDGAISATYTHNDKRVRLAAQAFELVDSKTFRIMTPGPNFTLPFESAEAALTWVERYLPCDGRKRRERSEKTAARSGRKFYLTHVLTQSGRVVTGATVYEIKSAR